ncbi:hypothetical protein SSS_07943 [Sarcoptes scabiei]|nr:hypothetical protein SSS_07943 [Sarcoptes scabiei]
MFLRSYRLLNCFNQTNVPILSKFFTTNSYQIRFLINRNDSINDDRVLDRMQQIFLIPRRSFMIGRFRSQSSRNTEINENRDQNKKASDDDGNENNSDDEDDDDEKRNQRPVMLMNFVPKAFPSLWSGWRNFYLINFVIRYKIDRDFSIGDFIEGAREALVTVSSHLANDRFDSLTDLIDPIALKEIRSNYEKLSLAQREEFSMKQSDILMTMINSIDIQSINDELKIFVNTSFHCL